MVVTANMTLPIIGLDNACQPSIQCYMGLGISGKHQQVGSIIPPANLLLFKKKKGKRQKATLVLSLVENRDPRTSLPERLSRLSWRRASVPVLGTQTGAFQLRGSCYLGKQSRS